MTVRRLLRLAALVVVLLAAVGPLAGPAAGGTQRTWRLVALGNSIPYGGRYCGGCTAYPSLLASALRDLSGHPVSVRNVGVPGLTTAGLLANVRGDDALRARIATADIVTITIGHNDTPWNSQHNSCDGAHAYFGSFRDARWSTYTGPCLAKEADALRARLASIITTIRSLRGGRPTLIEVTTDWNQLIGQPAVTALARQVSKVVLDRFALAVCAAARAGSARCGDVYHPFNGPSGTRSAGPLLAVDHDHASQKGHRAIANVLAAFGYAPLIR